MRWSAWRAFAVCSSSGSATRGRMAERPLVKNGEAKVSSPLRVYSSQGRRQVSSSTCAKATTPRIMSLASITFRRSTRSSTTPATGPAITAGSTRAIITHPSEAPEPVRCKARLSTAIELKWSPISLTVWPSQSAR